ncbi:MAG: radical SAM family heme chaperone HemW [Candidatus Edwardsbacteria bacterium]|jgi:oxygen-independent coproporphyrinogen-3 oxidase|nr:radical SAM family heme chaperone HemW [Candidatus Edwardsbacteria bacterium]
MRSLYVHIPYCRSKCRYCGFNSVPAGDNIALESYTRALVAEIRSAGPVKIDSFSDTVYFGGGTPSILPLRQLGEVLAALRELAPLPAGAELTIECNPETLDAGKLAGLRQLGFDRLSLGVQSFDDALLASMGRPHDAARAADSFPQARAAGFANIGLDLIFALPGQTLDGFRRDLDRAISLGPEHLSLYALTYEPYSEFGILDSQGKIERVPEDIEADMYLSAIATMAAAGYEHYEVSNFARPGSRSRHNLNYWHCGDYLGFGAGAHSHLGGRRWANVTDPMEYVKNAEHGESARGFEETLSRGQRLFEAVFLGLRMTEGIDVAAFTARWGAPPWSRSPEEWQRLEREGLVVREPDRVRLSQRGLLLSDGILARLAPASDGRSSP